jgi:hypothetical protein
LSEGTPKDVDWGSVEHYYKGLGHRIRRKDVKAAIKWVQGLSRALDKGVVIVGPGTIKV